MGDGSGSASGLMGDGGATDGTTLSPAAGRARAYAIAASYRASSSASALCRSSSSRSRLTAASAAW